MEAIRNVLVTDVTGAPSTRHRLVASTDWDEVQHWCKQVYMPYDAAPVGLVRQRYGQATRRVDRVERDRGRIATRRPSPRATTAPA
mgnify:CR=1 FL=1